MIFLFYQIIASIFLFFSSPNFPSILALENDRITSHNFRISPLSPHNFRKFFFISVDRIIPLPPVFHEVRYVIYGPRCFLSVFPDRRLAQQGDYFKASRYRKFDQWRLFSLITQFCKDDT